MDNAPDSLAVGVNCNLALQGNIPNPIVTSTIGATIITSMFDATASGFPFTQLWTDDEVAHIYWFVEDNMGHSYTFEYFVKFVDNTPPAFNLTGINDTLFFNSVVQVPPAPVIPIMDNCTGFTQTFVETTKPDTCEAGQFTRTWTATDASGNKSTFTQTIIIAADVTPPTITFGPQPGSSSCELLSTAYPAWLATQVANFSAQDPSGIKSLTNNAPASFPPGCKVPLTVTFKATDNCGLMIPTTAVFTTSDNQGPVVVVEPKDTVGYCSAGGNHLAKLGEWINKHAYLQATDACSAPLSYFMKMNNAVVDSAAVVTAFIASFDGACGTQQIGNQFVNKVSAFVKVEFYVRDACGTPTFAGEAVYGAVDTLPPVISGTDITEQCGGGNDQAALQNWINAKANATALDDCSASFWTNFSFTTSNGQSGNGTFNAGPYPSIVANNCDWYADVTFRASDECGNNSAKTLRFQIADTLPPVFTGLSPNITVYCPNPLPTTPAATITDNCDLSTNITFTRVYQDSICAGSYTVVTTWKATDDCGNTATIIQNIFVRDTTRPVFTLVPVGLLMRCDTFALPPVPVQGVNINATDLCSPVVSITTNTVSGQNPNPALCSHYSYNITRTFTAKDQCNNTQTATQLISVIDNLPPVPGGVLDTTALCSALTPFPAPAPIAIDACSGPTADPFFVSQETILDTCMGRYTLQLKWIANDVCGNQVEFLQLVHVVDTLAPTLSNIPANITVECDAIPEAPNSSTFIGADNCSTTVDVSFKETEIRNPDLSSCDHWTNYTVRREWTATDDCGNARVYTQNIQIEDTTPPAVVPPASITLPNETGECGAEIPIPPPLSVYDVCTGGITGVVLKDTMPITPLYTGSNNNALVDSMFFHFSTPNLPPNQPVNGNVTLTITVELADADLPSEYFKVFGENGVLLGKTGRLPVQCNSVKDTILTITAAQFNNWASDGELSITLAPNGFGGAAINPSCPNSRIRMEVAYNYATPQVPINLKYSLDGSAPAAYPPPGDVFLGIGTHSIVYIATDCAGNSSTASTQVIINDAEPPSITAPAPINIAVGANCSATVALPFPAISENCEMSGHLNKSSNWVPLSFIVDPDAGIIPADVTLGIPGVIPNAISNGTLRIRFKGDNGNPREFFNILHGGIPVTTTQINTNPAGQCQDTVMRIMALSAATINNWTANGNAILRAEANTNPGSMFDFDFINPCAPLAPDQTDGTSRIQASLEYSYAIINFTITRNSNAMIVATGALQGTQTTVDLTPGVYTVKYTTTDNAGLMGMTTFPLVVRDTIKPVAKCKPSLIINVNPSGVNPYILQPSEINNGSTDNCPSGLLYSLSQDTFQCTQAGSVFTVTLTVKDTSGNSATCSTVVAVQTAMPMPTYNTFNTLCEGDTLQLSANPPTPGTFSYMWTGPSFSTSVQNPIRLNATPDFQGLYTVKITGAGCSSTGSVTVNFASLMVPPITVSGGVTYCQGQNVVLGTQTVAGNNVTYMWYSNNPNPTLIGTSSLPILTINQPPPGVYHYFVRVKIGDCLTPNSMVVTVTVFARPPASVDDNFIVVCAGEPLAFSTSVTGTGLTYQWSGPLSWGSTDQNPLRSSAAIEAHSGFYTLTTFQNGCASVPPATVQVTVKYTPPKPQIIGNTSVCNGDTVMFLASVAGTNMPQLFEWQDPSQNIITTTINTLTIPNVSAIHCGNWRVRASYQNCFSEWSDVVNMCPQSYPVVTASSNSPICQDSTLRLTATSSFGNLDWSWTLPNNTPIYLQNPVLTPGQPGTYIVVGKTSHGCADTATVLVLGSLAPVIDTIVISGPTCSDGVSDACLTPTFTSSNAPFTFSWTQNGNPTPISTDLTLCFPDVTPASNGPYTFVVKDQYGCPSSSKTATLNVQAQVPVPTMNMVPNPVCAGGTVTLSVANTNNALYHWINPLGQDSVTTGPQLVLPNITIGQSGDYSMFVAQGVCQSVLSNIVTLVVNPIPAAPIPSSNQPVCQGDLLQFDANVIPNATYTWGGPNMFSSNLRNPSRSNAILAYEGVYNLKVSVKGCESPAATLNVDIMSPPKNPLIVPSMPEPICLEQPITAFLSVSLSTQTFGASYTWIDPTTEDTLSGPSTSAILNLSSLPSNLLTPGIHQFQVVAWKQDNANGQGCSSALSNIVSVRFDTIPDNFAMVGPDHPACASAPIILNATHPSGNVTGQWTQIGGPLVLITNRDSSTASFIGTAQNSYTFIFSLSSGGCKNFSTDTLTITAQNPEVANAGVDTFLCDATNFALNATQGQFSFGTWGQMGQNLIIADSTEPKTPVTGLNKGNRYFFVWTLADIGCGPSSDVVSVSYYSPKPNITGPKFVCTGEDCANLTAQEIQIWETGQWESATGTLEFSQENSHSTAVCNLVPGDNIVYWTINGGACGGNSRDTFIIKYEIFPVANPDAVSVAFGSSVTFQILTNDVLPTSPYTVEIITAPLSGAIIGNPSTGSYIYRPFSGFSGTDMLTYRICNEACDEACSIATVTFTVGPAGDCYVPSVFTPNGDDLNDKFQLPPECFIFGEGQDAKIEVTVFNQWGDYVYHKENFIKDVDYWDGTHNGQKLPSATYYYVVKIEGQAKPMAGFILLQR